MRTGPRRIFVVEDNPGDVQLLREALRMQAIECDFTHFETADEAIRAIGSYDSDSQDVPDLILLDFNIPRGDARDILVAAARNPALAGIPAAVVTSSVAPKDREQAMLLGARCFINKPAHLDAFLSEVGGTIADLLRSAQPIPD